MYVCVVCKHELKDNDLGHIKSWYKTNPENVLLVSLLENAYMKENNKIYIMLKFSHESYIVLFSAL